MFVMVNLQHLLVLSLLLIILNLSSCLAGVHSDIASARYDYWSSFARRPSEVVLAAGERAKVENFSGMLMQDFSWCFSKLYFVFLLAHLSFLLILYVF